MGNPWAYLPGSVTRGLLGPPPGYGVVAKGLFGNRHQYMWPGRQQGASVLAPATLHCCVPVHDAYNLHYILLVFLFWWVPVRVAESFT